MCIHLLQRFQAQLLQLLPLLNAHQFTMHTCITISFVLASKDIGCRKCYTLPVVTRYDVSSAVALHAAFASGVQEVAAVAALCSRSTAT